MNAKLCLHCGGTRIAVEYPVEGDALFTTSCRDCHARGKTIEASEEAVLIIRRRLRRP